MSSTPQFSQEQLTAARSHIWRQDGDAALTLEAVREWLAPLGLVSFETFAKAPAPSLVEATLGAANAEPTPEQIHVARSFIARLVSEGGALPLNLAGLPGEMPDFVVTAQVFSYLFTLRGDKGYKVAPQSSGPYAVTPLAVKVYEVLSERGALSAAELANELGRELTEAAVIRALVELWGQLRVLPLYGQNEETTLWEITTRRFLKPIKAGANAGVPTALSAILSLYLGQVVAASEEQVAAFLSNVVAGSRVHEVVLALTSARQLETVVIDGQTLLYIPGALPEFAEPEVEGEGEEAEGVEGEAVEGAEVAEGEDAPRIRSFSSGRANELRGKPVSREGAPRRAPVRTPGGAPKRATGRTGGRPPGRGGPSDRPAYPRRDGADERTRRPFDRSASAGGSDRPARPRREDAGDRPARPRTSPAFDRAARPRREDGDRPTRARENDFTRPWAEDSAPKTDTPAQFARFDKKAPRELGPREEKGLPPEKRRFEKPKPAEGEGRPFERKSYGSREGGGERSSWKPSPRYGGDRGSRESSGEGAPRSFERKPFSKKPFGAPRPGGDRKPFGAKPSFGGERKSFGDRKPFGAKPSFGGDRKPFGAKPFGDRKPGGFVRRDRPEGSSFGGGSDSRPPRRFEGGEGGRPERKPFGARPAFGGERKPFGDRKPFERKPFGAKPSFGGERKPFGDRKPFGAKPAFGGGERKPFERKPFGDRKPFGAKPAFGGERKSFGDRKPFGARPSGGGDRKPYGAKPGFSKPGGRFGSKPAYGSKPGGFRSPGPRRPQSGAGESGESGNPKE